MKRDAMENIIESWRGALSRVGSILTSTNSDAPTITSGRPSRLTTAPFPHCDDLVLHQPGICVHCDKFPDLQHDRIMDRINFTGEDEPYKLPDPASQRRPLRIIEQWPGNTPTTEEDIEREKLEWERFWRNHPELTRGT